MAAPSAAPPVPRSVRRWAEPAARIGFAAKGLVYVTLGVLAARAALGWRARAPDLRGAMRTMQQPLGPAVTALLAVGLLAYASWRLAQALLDIDGKGRHWGGLAVRAGFLASALVYIGMAATAAELSLGAAAHRRSAIRTWTARVMATPRGVWLVGLAGAVVTGIGLYQFYKAYVVKFDDRLRKSRMSRDQARWAIRFGRFGLAARGVVLMVIGWFLLQAALHADPGQVRGLEGALSALKQRSEGPGLLGVVSLGLIAYGLQSLMAARYERLRA